MSSGEPVHRQTMTDCNLRLKGCQHLEEFTGSKERHSLFIHTSLPHHFSVTPPFGYWRVKKMKM